MLGVPATHAFFLTSGPQATSARLFNQTLPLLPLLLGFGNGVQEMSTQVPPCLCGVGLPSVLSQPDTCRAPTPPSLF